MFDAAIVFIAWALYAKALVEPGTESALGLVIAARLWRVTDVYHG